jgi:hypothetical protein
MRYRVFLPSTFATEKPTRDQNMLGHHSHIILISAALAIVASMPTRAAEREAPKGTAIQPAMQMAAQTDLGDEPDIYGTGTTVTVTVGSGQPTAAKRLAVIAPRAVNRSSYAAGNSSRSGAPPLILGVRF